MRPFRAFFACFALLISSATIAATAPPFPRLATVNFSVPQNYDDPTYQANLAKFNLAFMSFWPGWNGGHSMTMEKVVENVKKMNPNTLLFLYINNNEVSPTNGSYQELIDKVNSMHWWLYPSGTIGAPVPSAYGGTTEINNTVFTAPDSNGDRFVDWYAKFIKTNFYVPTPSIDGFFTDNVFFQPRVTGDWNMDGIPDIRSTATVGQWYRQGYARHFSDLYNLIPGKYQLGNITDWGTPGASLSSMSGVLNGGMMEALIGFSYSPETWGGWNEMMRQYRVGMAAVKSPKLLVFGQVGAANDYAAVRYGLTSCLMDDGYYEFSLAADAYSGIFWFDEFSVNLGNASAGPSTSAWQKGVYRRDFDNGIALVNPKGNGTQTVQLEAGFKRIAGKQDPTTNNGQAVQSITLKERDGIILLRTQPATAPTAPPPTNSSVAQPLPPASVVAQ